MIKPKDKQDPKTKKTKGLLFKTMNGFKAKNYQLKFANNRFETLYPDFKDDAFIDLRGMVTKGQALLDKHDSVTLLCEQAAKAQDKELFITRFHEMRDTHLELGMLFIEINALCSGLENLKKSLKE